MSATYIAPRKAHRKWTIRLELTTDEGRVEIDADPGQWDTLRETGDIGMREAAGYLRAGLATEARVLLYKQLARDPKPRYDRAFYLHIDGGQVRIQRF